MLKNFIISSFRNTIRNKTTTIINVTGLGLSIGVAILILLYVIHEFNTDSFIKDKERIFRLEEGNWAIMGPGLASKIKEIFPQVEDAITVQTNYISNETALINNQNHNIFKYFMVSESFIEFFGFKVIEGEKQNPLNDIYSVVLTSSEAKRLFGNESSVGKSIILRDTLIFTVTAVIEDPVNFHLSYNAILPFKLFPIISGLKNWESMLTSNMNNPTYVKLKSISHQVPLVEKINAVLQQLSQTDNKYNFRLRPVSDIYFHGAVQFEGKVKHGNISFVWIMITVALLTLFLACVNFINLSTARASTRAKEIAVRKVVGGSRFTIAFQFIIESIVIALISLVVGIVFVEIASPLFGSLVQREISSLVLFESSTFLTLIIGNVLLGIVAGFYPALYLSSFSPIQAFKSKLLGGYQSSVFRKCLIVFQFAVSVILIICTLIIFSQLRYFTNYNVGFNKEQIVNLPIPRKVSTSFDVFKQKVLQIPDVIGVSQSISKMGNITWQESFIDSVGTRHNFSYIGVDPDFIKLLELQIIAGRDFDWNIPTDMRETIIINETMAKMLGYNNPIDRNIGSRFVSAKVIGVIKDFNFNSLHNPIGPLGLNYRGSNYNTINIKVNTLNLTQTLSQIEQLWVEYSPEVPFNYTFLNETFESSYRSEQRMGRMFAYFGVIAILIGCMGLFGLSTFMLQARVKEMGIRKVLGATTLKIISLIGREFTILVLISNFIAFPVAFYAMSTWLKNFPYQTSISIIYFVIALVISILLALLTVTYHSYKAANSNPVDSLKYE